MLLPIMGVWLIRCHRWPTTSTSDQFANCEPFDLPQSSFVARRYRWISEQLMVDQDAV